MLVNMDPPEHSGWRHGCDVGDPAGTRRRRHRLHWSEL